MASIGQDLKRERELRGITLQEIADSTKINLRFLQALEEDRLDALPGRFISRGIIRSYAGYIGLNQEEVLNRLLGTPRRETDPDSEETPEVPDTDSIPAATRRTFRMIFIAAFVLAVLIPLAIVLQRREPEPLPPPEKSAEEMKPVEERPHVLLPDPEPVWEGLTLSLTYQAETWIQVFADGQRVISGLMPAGEKSEVRADQEIVINIGNAGGPSFTINGRPGKPFGDPGRVLNDIRITLDNYRNFLEAENPAAKDRTRIP